MATIKMFWQVQLFSKDQWRYQEWHCSGYTLEAGLIVLREAVQTVNGLMGNPVTIHTVIVDPSLYRYVAIEKIQREINQAEQ